MIKLKGAGMVMAIMLISVCGWVAIVAFIIKPNMWVGSALCLFGGSLIGLAIVYLMRRWWFKGIEGIRQIGMKPFDTWKCHICGEERPDDKISVLSKPLIINGQAVSGGQQNIRYCNDRTACIEGAEEFSFFKTREGA